MQKKKNIASPSTTQHHDTPNNKTHFIKFRVTEIEKMELEHTAKLDVYKRQGFMGVRMGVMMPFIGTFFIIVFSFSALIFILTRFK